jgi:hypothetical protein
MNRAENVVVDNDMVVAKVFRRLRKALTAPASPPSSICG